MQPEIIGYTAARNGLHGLVVAVFAVGVALWGAYGLILGNWPIILANLVTLALVLTLVTLKIRFG